MGTSLTYKTNLRGKGNIIAIEGHFRKEISLVISLVKHCTVLSLLGLLYKSLVLGISYS